MIKAISNLKWNDIAFVLLYHIPNKYPISLSRIVYSDMGYSPTSFPFWIIGEPDKSAVNKGQQNL